MNIWDLVILVLVAVGVFRGVRRMRRKGGGCHGSCEGCSQCAGYGGDASSHKV